MVSQAHDCPILAQARPHNQPSRLGTTDVAFTENGADVDHLVAIGD